MKRVRAEALALVNWKGVFYERYELDRHVTALEGDNGAGKTTVMVAAYVVLLPDMSRLRFTNLGETGATGGDKGIWGRLGEAGRPAYAALDFRLPKGERVLAGVHLHRKGEPTVEPTPFMVSGLGEDVRLQDLLLLSQGELELVPELSELRDNAARLGGRLQVFGSAREYFGALFEHGITPMRLSTSEERNKLNEMLKTSMTGGMSKGLLQELRSFLLQEEGGLADTLRRMRTNLAACRRTRTEVLESQRLEREIGSIYEAGEEMFAAGIAATRERADEVGRRVRAAEERRREADVRAETASQALATTKAAAEDAVGLKERTAEEAVRAAARERAVGEALVWAGKVKEHQSALAAATEARDEGRERRARTEEGLERAFGAVREASENRERAAAGLADLQKGLEELHRRAADHRRVSARLFESRQLLARPELSPEEIPEAERDAVARLTHVDSERRALSRRLDDASAHRAEHEEALTALFAVVDGRVEAEEALEEAHVALARVRGCRDAAARRDALGAERRSAEAEATRQARAVERAEALGLTWDPGHGRGSVSRALDAVENSLAALADRARAADEAAAEAAREQEVRRAEIEVLEDRKLVFREHTRGARRLSEAVGAPVGNREELDAARATLLERRSAARALCAELAVRQEELMAEARQLLHAGGRFPTELLTLRDELTAELLASHFDDVDMNEAAELEARLGPLAQALVVSDVKAATARLGDRPDSLPTVWLVAEDAALSLDPEDVDGAAGGDVVVGEGEARRVTRIPERPTLGRVARERRATELKRETGALDPKIEGAQRAAHEAASALGRADALLEGLSVWLLGDPRPAIEAAARCASEAATAGRAARLDAERARAEASALRPRCQGLRALLPDSALLDAPDAAARVADLDEELAAAETAAAELARVGDAPRTLERHLTALRHVPWSEIEEGDARERLSALDVARDALRDGLEALRHVSAHREALLWADAAPRLEAEQGLVPALQGQLDDAKAHLDRSGAEERMARAARDEATAASQTADAEHLSALAQHAESERRLAECSVDDPSEAELDRARAELAAAGEAAESAEAELGRLRQELGRHEAADEAATEEADDARTTEDDERKQAGPVQEAWEKLRRQVEAAGLLEGALAERLQDRFPVRGSVNLSPMAQGRRDVLIERLHTAQGGPSVVADVERALSNADQTAGEGYLHAWLAVRSWLLSRLPAQVAEVDEPLVALGRFRDGLEGLVARLDRQERELRGASEDVARGVDVQIRKAQGRIRRLNGHLDGVEFGSIAAIRVRMQRVERMEQVLRALRSGEAQGLLFQAELPFEEALAEIFKRFGGGRTGGQKLLDYREYIQLAVEVRRHEATAWEVANPTRLSTGEAIGVGAALMMVVLTEWERDANLLRGRRSSGSMRLLFLDEANRLDKANLGTVFDLCRNLDLQLIVAAPEVARAEGCTVFRLARTRRDDGREEVVVSGRRVLVREAER